MPDGEKTSYKDTNMDSLLCMQCSFARTVQLLRYKGWPRISISFVYLVSPNPSTWYIVSCSSLFKPCNVFWQVFFMKVLDQYNL